MLTDEQIKEIAARKSLCIYGGKAETVSVLINQAIREALELNDKQPRGLTLGDIAHHADIIKEKISSPQPCPECEKLKERLKSTKGTLKKVAKELDQAKKMCYQLTKALCEAVKK